MKQIVILLAAVSLAACQPESNPEETAAEDIAATEMSPADAMNDVADRYYAWAMERAPEIAYFAAIDLERHDGLFDNSPQAQAAAEKVEDAFLAEVEAIDSAQLVGKPEWIAKAMLEQRLRADVAQRVCRLELWNISQMGGWHSGYSQIAMLQPVDTPELREQALTRWAKFPAFVEQEIANLKSGVEQGYTVPKSVTGRVIAQLDGLLALSTEESPFYSMAVRAEDEEFAVALKELVETGIQPALQRARDYLQNDYLPAAREELSITAIPNGRECYDALLFGYTTLDRPGEEVYELGQQTVAANKTGIIELGRAAYETEDFDEILERAKNDPADKFASAEELLQFSKDMVARAEEEMPNWVGTMPEQAVEVVPFEKHEEGTGRSAHYNPGNADRPAEYRIPLATPDEEGRGNAEATAFHEAWPGHHLQVATFQAVEGLHPVTRIIWFSGPGEGWARYSEALAEEMGLYQSTSGPILRRAWPARGMVVDPGIHLFGWTREEAKAYMAESGRFPLSSGDEMVDRIAIIPGQLTAYDSGGLEILALRHQAEEALGDDFDIREFHDRVLENGTIPLGALRQHVEAWIASKQQ
ncbi:MAG: DUF885 domain-containing protein [Woeseiaceae bacterium]|jgi:uncharacterized protein (DUF885 family)